MIKMESVCFSNSRRIACVNSVSKHAMRLIAWQRREGLVHILAKHTLSLEAFISEYFRAEFSGGCIKSVDLHIWDLPLKKNIPQKPLLTVPSVEVIHQAVQNEFYRAQLRLRVITVHQATSWFLAISFYIQALPLSGNLVPWKVVNRKVKLFFL